MGKVVRPTRAAILLVGIAVAILALSGGTASGPTTPDGPAHLPAPFVGVATVGSGGPVASVDTFGSIVNLRSPGPAGKPVIHTPLDRQRGREVPPTNGLVVRVGAQGRAPLPLWRADSIEQRYEAGSNVLVTVAEAAAAKIEIRDAMEPGRPAFIRELTVGPSGEPSYAGGLDSSVRLQISARFDFDDAPREIEIDPGRGLFSVSAGAKSVTCKLAPVAEIEHDGDHFEIEWRATSELKAWLACGLEGESPPSDGSTVIEEAVTADREWLARSRPLGPGAPDWAADLYNRSLLVLRSLVDSTTGAAPAAVRDFWHYVWPRDAATIALALSETGHRDRARAVARFLSELEVERAARFTADGLPVADGREPQGDGEGWLRLARRAGGLEPDLTGIGEWRDRGDYGERHGDRGDYLANAIAAGAPSPQIVAEFRVGDVLVRESLTPDAPLDAAVAWAVRPFARPALYGLARNTLLRLAADTGPYGLHPSTDWPGRDPWTASTASVAWSLAALEERDAALSLATAVRDAATPIGLLPERVDATTGKPASTTPLAWSHALAILMLRELWPERARTPKR